MGNTAGQGKTFYGWWIMRATSAIMFIAGGIGFYTFSVFMKPLEEEFGWTRADLSNAVGLWALMGAFAAPLVGLSMHRLGARATMGGAAVITAIAYALMGKLSSMPMLFAIMALVGVGLAGVTQIPSQTLISNWFVRFKGNAMGRMMVRIGVGGLVFPPTAAYLIGNFGWRNAFFCFSGVFLVTLIPLILLFIRTKPADLGLLPDGDSPSDSSANEVAEVPGLSTKEAAGTTAFWLLLILYVLQYLSQSGISLHFVPFAEDMGWRNQICANFLGTAMGVSIAGRIVFGRLADKFQPQHLMAVASGMFAAAVLVLEIGVIRMGLRSSLILALFAVLYGCAMGSMAVYPVLVARCFGLRNFSKILGIIMIAFYLGIIIGPVFAGKVSVSTGSYEVAFLAFTAMFIGCGILCLLIRSPLERQLASKGPAE